MVLAQYVHVAEIVCLLFQRGRQNMRMASPGAARAAERPQSRRYEPRSDHFGVADEPAIQDCARVQPRGSAAQRMRTRWPWSSSAPLRSCSVAPVRGKIDWMDRESSVRVLRDLKTGTGKPRRADDPPDARSDLQLAPHARR